MDLKVCILILITCCNIPGLVQGQDKTEIANHVINKVFNGRPCNTRPKFDRSGKVKVKLGGRLVHYICGRGSVLIGDKYSVCVDGELSHPVPVCAYGGCGVKNNLYPSGIDVETHVTPVSGEVTAYSYSCAPGYVLQGGDELVYCNQKWRGDVPTACVLFQGFTCDFENVSSPHCNWTGESDQGIRWRRHSEETLLEGTGPDFDHTYGIDGTGHYLYVDSTDAPEGSTAELFSPWQHVEETTCLEFWHHMHGNQTNSTLAAFLQTEFNIETLLVLWVMEGGQGDQWNHALVTVPTTLGPFRVLFQATLNSKDNSDIAIDDVSIMPCDALSKVTEQKEDKETTMVVSTAVHSEGQQPTTSFYSQAVTTTRVVTAATVNDTTEEVNEFTSQAPNTSVSVNKVIGFLKSPDSKKSPLVVGLVIGSVGLVLAVLLGVYIIRKRRHRDLDSEDQDTRAFAYTTVGSDIALQ